MKYWLKVFIGKVKRPLFFNSRNRMIDVKRTFLKFKQVLSSLFSLLKLITEYLVHADSFICNTIFRNLELMNFLVIDTNVINQFEIFFY